MAKYKRSIRKLPSLLFLVVLIIAVAGYFYGKSDVFSEKSSQPVMPPAVTQGSSMKVYCFDVGQGTSQLVRIPDDEGFFDILIDTGEFQYAASLVENLRDLGISELDIVIASHPHNDHMGGMDMIIEEFPIGEFFTPRIPDSQVPTTYSYERMLEALIEKNVKVSVLDSETDLELPSGAYAEVFSPTAGDEWEDLNDYSGVLKIGYRKSSFIFTGDAEAGVERKILEGGYDATADVLICGHHGSSTSSSWEFLNAVNPKYAVISCGKDNRYGHPHDETLEKLNKINCMLYRTDKDGTILAETNEEKINFTTVLPSIERND